MFTFNIVQNQDTSPSKIKDESLELNLSLYEELGDEAYKKGDEYAALNWYTKGLTIAREFSLKDKIKLFSNLILASL